MVAQHVASGLQSPSTAGKEEEEEENGKVKAKKSRKQGSPQEGISYLLLLNNLFYVSYETEFDAKLLLELKGKPTATGRVPRRDPEHGGGPQFSYIGAQLAQVLFRYPLKCVTWLVKG